VRVGWSWRGRRAVVAAGIAGTVTALAVTAALAAQGHGAADAGPAVFAPPLLTASPGPASPDLTAKASASGSSSRPPSGSPRPKPSRKPTHVALPPPPHPPQPRPSVIASSAGTCPSYTGTPAPKAQVHDALLAAAAHAYWPAVGGPDITLAPELIEAVAWQESGWQSTIVSCYGAIGTMQMTVATANFMNNRFGTSNDVHTLTGNTDLGAQYLQWLVRYFGDVYFQSNYDLTVVDPNNPTLLDAVLAAYNVGPGAVDTPAGLVIPNRPYVNAVEAEMVNQPWTGS
jgi:hypothetical protein